jgi:hypothetical protein
MSHRRGVVNSSKHQTNPASRFSDYRLQRALGSMGLCQGVNPECVSGVLPLHITKRLRSTAR